MIRGPRAGFLVLLVDVSLGERLNNAAAAAAGTTTAGATCDEPAVVDDEGDAVAPLRRSSSESASAETVAGTFDGGVGGIHTAGMALPSCCSCC